MQISIGRFLCGQIFRSSDANNRHESRRIVELARHRHLAQLEGEYLRAILCAYVHRTRIGGHHVRDAGLWTNCGKTVSFTNCKPFWFIRSNEDNYNLVHVVIFGFACASCSQYLYICDVRI